jgi:hypothetical protein
VRTCWRRRGNFDYFAKEVARNLSARRFNSRPSACNTSGLPAKLGMADNFAECESLRKPPEQRVC